MSADNGVYVLQTYGPEFRVAYAQAIDNIYEGFDDGSSHWLPDLDAMKIYFGKSSVYLTLEEALDAAEKIAYDYDYLEDGVCVIPDFVSVKFPTD